MELNSAKDESLIVLVEVVVVGFFVMSKGNDLTERIRGNVSLAITCRKDSSIINKRPNVE